MSRGSALVRFGNDLYTGARSVAFVPKRRLWYTISAIVLLVCVIVPIMRGGFVFGIEFRGGSEFRVSESAVIEPELAADAVHAVLEDTSVQSTVIGGNTIRVQTEQLSESETQEVRAGLARTYGVEVEQVATSFVGPTWGADVSRQAIISLIVFVALAAVFMAVYFRTWKMSLAALIKLVHDLVITVGIYGVFGFEISPAAVIGFLTILGYSLYDTVIVFDKVRENTAEDGDSSVRTFAESVNLGVNQTLVRSINTGVIAVLPVAGILWIGAGLLGAGTLMDIALALFVGILVGTYSTIFFAAPLYSQFRENEGPIREHTERVHAARESAIEAAG